MKSNKCIICLVLVIGLLLTFFTPTVRAVEEEEDVYTKLFQEALTADGANATDCAYELAALFDDDPYSFVVALASKPVDIWDTVINKILYVNSYGADEKFLTTLDFLVSCETNTVVVDELLQRIIVLIDNWQQEMSQLAITPWVFDVARFGFDAVRIREIIDANIEVGSEDEEFYAIVANAYLASPSLFVETIADLPSETVNFLARAISFNLNKTNRASLAKIPTDCKSELSLSIAEIIYSEVSNLANTPITSAPADVFVPKSIKPGAEVLFYDNITIYSASFSAVAPVAIHKPCDLNVSFGSNTGSTTSKTYTIKVYSTGSSSSLMASKNVTLASGSTGANTTISVVFNSVGSQSIIVQIYDSTGNCLDSRNIDGIVVKSGMWRVTVALPQDRNQYGTLCLYNHSGTLLHACTCRGRSVSNASPLVTGGNTPTGTSWGQLEGPHSNTAAYGDDKVIALKYPISGDLLTSGREGILIHGGDLSNGCLNFTDGCIRIYNNDQEYLQTLIEGMINNQNYATRGHISVTEQ